MKIIHLSDLHLGYKDMSDIFEGMLERLFSLCQPASEYVIVITGDLVDDATEVGQLEKAKDYLDVIKEEGFNLLIVPGNHDYGTGSEATIQGMENYKKIIFGDQNTQFPKVNCIGDIAFIGLDSMEGEVKKNQGKWADGEIGKLQLDELAKHLSTNKDVIESKYTVVYLHHHPIDPGKFFKRKFHGLDDADDLRKILEAHKVDALLFGHNHDGKQWNGNWGIKRAYDASSSTGKKSPQSKHRLIDMSAPVYTDFDLEL